MDNYESPKLIDNLDFNSSVDRTDPQPMSAFILIGVVTVLTVAFVANIGVGWNGVIGPDGASS